MAPVKCKIEGSKFELEFEMYKADTIRELKEKIVELTNLGWDRLTLRRYYQGEELEIHRTLEDYGYTETATIHLAVKPTHGDPEFNLSVKLSKYDYKLIKVRESTKVEDLKDKIEELWDIPAEKLTLMRFNTPMEDSASLFDYYISSFASIDVAVKP